MDCFDADVVVFAARSTALTDRKLAALFRDADHERPAGAGSVLLLPEVMSKPRRLGNVEEVQALAALLGRLELWPVDRLLAARAAELGAKYTLRAADAVHLATAVSIGADRFITNNRRDFRKAITEVDVVYPDDLPDEGG